MGQNTQKNNKFENEKKSVRGCVPLYVMYIKIGAKEEECMIRKYV